MNLLRIAILVIASTIILLSYIVYQQQIMIYELFGDMTDLMEIMVLWLEQQGIVPDTQGTEILYGFRTRITFIFYWHTFFSICVMGIN